MRCLHIWKDLGCLLYTSPSPRDAHKSRIIENDKEEIINTEVKDLRDGIGKYVEFTVVETDKKGGKYRIINCFPSKEPQDSIIKTVKTNYKLSN